MNPVAPGHDLAVDWALDESRDRSKQVLLAHGGGGQLTDELLNDVVLPRLANPILNAMFDSAVLPCQPQGRLAFTIDSYVVQPWRFPGADVGRLAVSGTVNDLAVCGAQPIGLALSLILAEGFAKSHLEFVLDSIHATAAEAGVHVVTGDTKVVGRDHADSIYITTAGLGVVPTDRCLTPDRVRPGDAIIVNGPIGEHGLAVMLEREMPEVQSVLRSDAAPLNGVIESLLKELGEHVVFMRDPTRAGLAGVLTDLARQSGWRVGLNEQDIPVRAEARHAADMLGLDLMEVANEGKVVVVVRPEVAGRAMEIFRGHPLGKDCAVIGHVEDRDDGLCVLNTAIGGHRIVQKPYGEQLPRIC